MAKKPKRNFWRGVLLVALLLALGAAGLWTRQWMGTLRVERLDVRGATHAAPEALLALARVDSGAVLMDVDPVLVADRLQRHPWVAAASATRLPTGTLALRVTERVPVLLVLDALGRPAYYLDRNGYAMPVPETGGAYDVPLLRGRVEAYHPVRPVQNETVRDLLAALAEADAATDALVAEFELRGPDDLWLYTTPTGTRDALAVRLGRGTVAGKLVRLKAFWQQAVLPQPEQTFQVIDLRFDSQIVTQERVVTP